jgi:hypothetical protein
MPYDQPFSRRHGFVGHPKEITIREDAPRDFRAAFLEIIRKVGSRHQGHPELEIRNAVATNLGKYVDPAIWLHYEDAWKQVERLVYECDWFHVYDLVEAVNSHFGQMTPVAAQEFSELINDRLVGQGIGWQLVNGKVVTRGDEAFEQMHKTALAELHADKRPTTANQIDEALRALSRRPEPNLRGAIFHGMGALECLIRDLAGDEKLTLGEALKKHPDLVPKPVDEALSKLWGYASNEARHVAEGKEPNRNDAEFIVGLAFSTCTYLTRKGRTSA